MSSNSAESHVSIYSTPVEFDAEMVRGMLEEEGIPSMVENANGPFPGLAVTQCQVLVKVEDEGVARRLVAEHEARLRQRALSEGDEEIEDDSEPAEDE